VYAADLPTPVVTGDLAVLIAVLGHSWLTWILFVVVLWLLITRLAETYEGAAKLLGPFGKRVMRGYQQRHSERYMHDVAEQAKVIAAKLEADGIPADYELVKTQLDNVITRVTDLEVENAALRSFVVYDEQWHFAVLLQAAQNGSAPNFPIRLTWLEFREKWRQGWRPPAGPPTELKTYVADVGKAARRAARQAQVHEEDLPGEYASD